MVGGHLLGMPSICKDIFFLEVFYFNNDKKRESPYLSRNLSETQSLLTPTGVDLSFKSEEMPSLFFNNLFNKLGTQFV